MIESTNNEKVKFWAKLKDKKYQMEAGMFLVEGEHLIEEALNSGHLCEVIVLDGYDYDFEKKFVVNEQVMKKITSLTTIPRAIGVADIR